MSNDVPPRVTQETLWNISSPLSGKDKASREIASPAYNAQYAAALKLADPETAIVFRERTHRRYTPTDIIDDVYASLRDNPQTLGERMGADPIRVNVAYWLADQLHAFYTQGGKSNPLYSDPRSETAFNLCDIWLQQMQERDLARAR